MTDASRQVACRMELGGVELHLLPDRGVWCPEYQTLYIADPHFGKEATFRAAAIPIPDVTDRDLDRLDRLVAATGCSRLVVLGDLVHHRQGMSARLVAQIAEWRSRRSALDVVLVRGNHDRAAGTLPRAWSVRCVESPFPGDRLGLRHEPDFADRNPTLAGHLHPKHRLQRGTDRIDLPCFLLRGSTMVLPAFGSFIDGMVNGQTGDRAFVIADCEVFALPPL